MGILSDELGHLLRVGDEAVHSEIVCLISMDDHVTPLGPNRSHEVLDRVRVITGGCAVLLYRTLLPAQLKEPAAPLSSTALPPEVPPDAASATTWHCRAGFRWTTEVELVVTGEADVS
jgi:hypothetical protein